MSGQGSGYRCVHVPTGGAARLPLRAWMIAAIGGFLAALAEPWLAAGVLILALAMTVGISLAVRKAQRREDRQEHARVSVAVATVATPPGVRCRACGGPATTALALHGHLVAVCEPHRALALSRLSERSEILP